MRLQAGGDFHCRADGGVPSCQATVSLKGPHWPGHGFFDMLTAENIPRVLPLLGGSAVGVWEGEWLLHVFASARPPVLDRPVCLRGSRVCARGVPPSWPRFHCGILLVFQKTKSSFSPRTACGWARCVAAYSVARLGESASGRPPPTRLGRGGTRGHRGRWGGPHPPTQVGGVWPASPSEHTPTHQKLQNHTRCACARARRPSAPPHPPANTPRLHTPCAQPPRRRLGRLDGTPRQRGPAHMLAGTHAAWRCSGPSVA